MIALTGLGLLALGWVQSADATCPSSLSTHPLVGKEGRFSELQHAVKGILRVLSDCTVRLDQFHYDGTGPDAFLVGVKNGDWANSVRLGPRLTQSASGGSLDGIIPATYSLDSFDKIAIWCYAADAEFGGVNLSALQASSMPMPSPAVTPTPTPTATATATPATQPVTSRSCVVLDEGNLNMAWSYEASSTTVEITIQHNAPTTEWVGVGFPLSGADKPTMVGSEVAILHYNGVEGRVSAIPYMLSSKSQCDYTDTGKSGVCPSGLAGAFVLTAATEAEGVTTVVLTAKLAATAAVTVDPAAQTYVTWATGPVLDRFPDGNPVVGYHLGKAVGGKPVRFTDDGAQCATQVKPRPAGDGGADASSAPNSKTPVDVLRIDNGTTLTATIGLAPNYPAPEGGWGVSYWINGKESPVLEIVRGSTVTFSVEATADHPLYITTSEVGGDPQVTGSFAGGQGVSGEVGSPKTFDLVTDKDTPALLYYQCSTHRRLGWKINVVEPDEADPSDESSAAATFAPARLAILFAGLAAAVAVMC